VIEEILDRHDAELAELLAAPRTDILDELHRRMQPRQRGGEIAAAGRIGDRRIGCCWRCRAHYVEQAPALARQRRTLRRVGGLDLFEAGAQLVEALALVCRQARPHGSPARCEIPPWQVRPRRGRRRCPGKKLEWPPNHFEKLRQRIRTVHRGDAETQRPPDRTRPPRLRVSAVKESAAALFGMVFLQRAHGERALL
jgi:hypothetical protein